MGTQAQFRKKKPPVTYRHDSSLSPTLDWDGRNAARELDEWLLGVIEQAAVLPAPHELPSPAAFTASDGRVVVSVRSLVEALDQLKRLGRPFLEWAGKAERLSFDVPTLPLFVHERLSTKAIVETLVGHKTDKQTDSWEVLGDPRHSLADQVLKAYEYQDDWVIGGVGPQRSCARLIRSKGEDSEQEAPHRTVGGRKMSRSSGSPTPTADSAATVWTFLRQREASLTIQNQAAEIAVPKWLGHNEIRPPTPI